MLTTSVQPVTYGHPPKEWLEPYMLHPGVESPIGQESATNVYIYIYTYTFIIWVFSMNADIPIAGWFISWKMLRSYMKVDDLHFRKPPYRQTY